MAGDGCCLLHLLIDLYYTIYTFSVGIMTGPGPSSKPHLPVNKQPSLSSKPWDMIGFKRNYEPVDALALKQMRSSERIMDVSIIGHLSYIFTSVGIFFWFRPSCLRHKIPSPRRLNFSFSIVLFRQDPLEITKGHFNQNERHLLLWWLCWQIIKMNYWHILVPAASLVSIWSKHMKLIVHASAL